MEPEHITDRHMYSGCCTLKRAISRMITGLIVAIWTDRSDFEFKLLPVTLFTYSPPFCHTAR